MKKVILFIHGLGGKKESFGNFNQIIEDDYDLKEWEVAFYEYPSSLIHIPYYTASPKIQSVSKDLEGTIEGYLSGYDEMVIVCHSMGGLIAKKYLIDNLEKIKLSKNVVSKVVLYATPNFGSDLAFGVYSFHPQVSQLRNNSDFLEYLNKDFNSSDITKYIDFYYIIGSLDSVVNRTSASGLWNDNYKEIANKAHMGKNGVANAKDYMDKTFIYLKTIKKKKKICIQTIVRRKDLYKQIEPLFNENKSIFDSYGPENEYRFNSESEETSIWKRKIIDIIIPNNDEIIKEFKKNYSLLKIDEKVIFNDYKQHVDDFKAKYTGLSDSSGKSFPLEINSLLRSLNE